MTVPVWPAAPFPQQLDIQGFSKGLRDGRLSSQTDAGPGIVRRRFSSAVSLVSCQTPPIDQAEVARFERFWTEETGGGVLTFLMPDQLNDGTELLDEDLNEITTQADSTILVALWWRARFGDEAPAVTPIDGEWFRIAFGLKLMP